ncbi:LytTR family DNA-binding domain-containing protein [uncultured Tenacibaculum sp.]|uniref:LytR/AlgR family response regulator transcription factor n=1 Tax=uncultured Tenacibaculum sp. TaxID=174713 RepID=UPI0026130AC6|nr:LytTR family DNA-binding domain-containing protein [uncultured Tenacibaculum sp.]
MINAIIVENDFNSLNYILKILNNYQDISILGTANTIKKGEQLIKDLKPDILFLDIELDDGNAFDLLDNVKTRKFEVIFTTAYDTYYQKAFQHFALNYLLKPIDPQELDSVLNHYRSTTVKYNSQKLSQFRNFIKNDNSKILLNIGGSYIAVSLDDIIYCKANQNFTIFQLTSGKSEMISNPLKYYTELFFDKNFFKANRSFLINITHIKRIIKRESIEMTNSETINVSVKNRQNLNEMIKTLS